MNIRFLCPSCRQPLEIDQQWAGQSVACPYCKRVVAAPMSNSWEPPVSVPTARPAGSGFEPPPPPMGVAPTMAMSPSGSSARWALGLAIFSVVLMLMGVVIWIFLFGHMLQQRIGSQATPEEMNRTMQEMLASGQVPRSPMIGIPILAAAVFSIFSLGLAVRSFIRGERHHGTAITACILSVLLLFCQLGMVLSAVANHAVSSTSISAHKFDLHLRP